MILKLKRKLRSNSAVSPNCEHMATLHSAQIRQSGTSDVRQPLSEMLAVALMEDDKDVECR